MVTACSHQICLSWRVTSVPDEVISVLTRANTCFIAETGRYPCIIPLLCGFLSDEIYFIISKPMNTTDAGIPV